MATNIFKYDFYRITGKKYKLIYFLKEIIKGNHICKFLYVYRKKNNNIICKIFFRKYVRKYGLEIYSNSIDKGLYLGHAYMITINPNVKIGKNCNIHKGVTIGQTNRGGGATKKGTPTIGNEVWIGINATIVGNITIGDDVLIAPNSYVNQDIPSHSIVFGNPCIIKHRENATASYINRKV